MTMSTRPAARASKALGEAGFLKAVRAGRIRRAAPAARRAHALPRARDPGVPRRARRLRLRHAGARHRLDLALRHAGAEAALSAAGARRQGDRRLRAVRAGSRLRRRRAGDDRRRRTATRMCGIDGEKTWISNGGIADHYVVFARTGEAPGAQGPVGLHGRCRHAGPDGRRAHRGDRAASAGDAAVRRRAACR